MPIRPLPQHLVNQIAAGEVVERPASVVKELLENAVDAGATRIGVHLRGGGVDLIEVSDDGRGIPAEEIHLSIAPHATSKIAEAGDLERILTLGFRGEALASIASVSRFRIRSRPREQAEAMVVEAEGGHATSPRPAAGPPGTLVSVQQLFLNAPARRKFLKTTATETARAAEVVRSLALARPEIAFRLEIDGRVAFDLPGGGGARRRVIEVLGRELEPSLVEVHPPDEEAADRPGAVRVWGFVGRPELAKGHARACRIYLNGRSIHDRLILHAVREGFRGLLPGDRHPVAVLHVEIDPAAVDVNVHPAKAEVRFREGERVHAAVRRTVRAALAASDLVPTIETTSPSAPATSAWSLRAPSAAPQSPLFTSAGPARGVGGTGRSLSLSTEGGPKGFEYSEARVQIDEAASRAAPPPRAVLQAGGTFLIGADESGLLIVDQHALHERIEFERLSQRILAGPLERQTLLAPEPVAVEAVHLDAFESLRPLLDQIGLEVAPFGTSTLAIQSVPSLFASRGVDATEFLREVLDLALERGAAVEPQALLEPILSMMACKASVRGGEAIGGVEAASLLDRAEEIERSSRCPHGRPTMLRVPWPELRRRFGRS